MKKKEIKIKGRKVVGGKTEGKALVTQKPISMLGGVVNLAKNGPKNGTVLERGHDLEGLSLKDKILVMPGAKGSSAWSSSLHQLVLYNEAPRGILITRISSLSALGVTVSNIPTLTDFDKDILKIINSGDWIKLDADNGVVLIYRGTPQ